MIKLEPHLRLLENENAVDEGNRCEIEAIKKK